MQRYEFECLLRKILKLLRGSGIPLHQTSTKILGAFLLVFQASAVLLNRSTITLRFVLELSMTII